MTKRAALILAGGQARRFQRKQKEWKDKALARLYGKPLLVHVVEAVNNVVDDILICINEEARKSLYSEVLHEYSFEHVKFCVDEKFPHVKGPLTAITTGLKFTDTDYCITLPCDVPLMQPAVVEHLFKAVRGSSVAVPVWPDGRLESLILTCERSLAAQIAVTLCKLRRHRPDDIIRGASRVTFVSTVGDLKGLDPEFRSFVNINFQEDLTLLPTRAVEDGPIKETIRLKVGCPSAPEWKQIETALEHYHRGRFLEASNLFSSLSSQLEKRKVNFWAAIIRENEGRSLYHLSEIQQNMRLKKEYHVKSKIAFKKAAENYGLEAEFYEKNQLNFLARRAKTEEAWATSKSEIAPK